MRQLVISPLPLNLEVIIVSRKCFWLQGHTWLFFGLWFLMGMISLGTAKNKKLQQSGKVESPHLIQ